MNSKNKLILWLSSAFLVSLSGLYFALQTWVPFMWFLLISGVVGLAYVGYRERKLLADFFQMKTTKHGLSMGSVLIVTLFFLVLVNYFSVKFVHVFDLSMTQHYTLSDQSKKIIDYLDQPLEVRFFYKEGLQNTDFTRRNFSNLVKVFETYSSKVKVSYVEMNSNPSLTELFGATRGLGEAFVSYKGKMNRVEAQDQGQNGLMYTEQDFTNAVIKTTREKFKVVYFLEGHGERGIDQLADENSLSSFKQALEKNSYKVETLNLFQTGAIPADADLLIIAGATKPFQKTEMAAIDMYLSQGKPLMVLFADKGAISPGPVDILRKMGWQLSSRYAFNILNTPNGPMVSTDQPTVANQFSEQSDITKYFGQQKNILIFRPHPLKEIESRTAVTDSYVEVLVSTSNQAVAIDQINTTDYSGTAESFDLAVHFKTKYGAKAKAVADLVFISDVSMAANMFFSQANNKELLLNTVSYMAKETDLLALPPKEPGASRLKVMGPEFNTYFKFMIVGLFLPLPLLFLGLSVALWFKRRHA